MHCPSKQNSLPPHLVTAEHFTCPGCLNGLPGYPGFGNGGPIGNGIPEYLRFEYGGPIGSGLPGYLGFGYCGPI